MPTIGTDLKTQTPLTPSQTSISTPQSKFLPSKGRKKKVAKSPNLEKKTVDKENALNLGRDQKQKIVPSSERKQPLTPLYSPPEAKFVGLFSPGAGSPTYKIVRRMEDKDRVKVGFVVANGPSVGMHVVKVTPKLPADNAGLMVGDVINVINGHQTLRVEDFRIVASNFRAGDIVPIKITREVDGTPQNLHLLMRLPKPREGPIGPSPQKEMARQVKMELAKMKEEKDRLEREALEKIKKEKQKIVAEKKMKEDKMREELEKRKAAAKLKRIEMKKRQEQLKNEEVVLLQELRARRAARKADIQAQAELTEKQKLEELAKVQEDEQKWAQVLAEETRLRQLNERKKQEEIKQIKEEKQKKREERDKLRKEQDKIKEAEKKKQEELILKDKEQKEKELARKKEELRKQRELELRKRDGEGDDKKEVKTPGSATKKFSSPKLLTQTKTPSRGTTYIHTSKSPFHRATPPPGQTSTPTAAPQKPPVDDVRAMIVANQIPGLDKNDLINKPLQQSLERKEVGKGLDVKGLDVKGLDVKGLDVKEKKVTTVNGGKKRTVPGKLAGGGSKTLPLPSKPSSTPPPSHTSPTIPKSLISTVQTKAPTKIISKPGNLPKSKPSVKSGTLPLPVRRASDTTTTPVRKPGVSLENSVGKRTVTVPDAKTNSLPPNNGAKSPEPSAKLPAGLSNKPLSSGVMLPPRSNSVTSNSSNGPPIKLRGGGKKSLVESEKTSTSSLVEPSGSVSSTTEPQLSVNSPVITITNSTTSSTETTAPSVSSDSGRPEEKSHDGKDTSVTIPTTNGVPPTVQDLPSPAKSLSTSSQQPPVSPPPTSHVPTPTSTTPAPEVNNKRKSKIVVPPGKGHVLQKLRQNIAVMGSEVQNK